jgi:hypothetical protein
MSTLIEVAALFLKLRFTAFGGPAAHIGIIHNEVVVTRKWLTDEQFPDLLGATNLIAILSLFLLLRYTINSTWLIVSGAFAGFLSLFIFRS